MALPDLAAENMEHLAANSYPGRIIFAGRSGDGDFDIQGYAIMGRSLNSRNRIFVMGSEYSIETAGFDPSKVEDPRLIIYKAMRRVGPVHIVSNGDQTDTIAKFLIEDSTFTNVPAVFERAINIRKHEPDAPNYTPRISAILDERNHRVIFSQIWRKTQDPNDPDDSARPFYNSGIFEPGQGQIVHTYSGDGNPLPPFKGEPYDIKLGRNIAEIADEYWAMLDHDNKVALVVKGIHRDTHEVKGKVIQQVDFAY